MKLLKIMLITLILGGLAVPLVSCGSEPDSAVSENQVVTVQRGNLIIDITASGNLALSHKEELAFDLFYQEGTVEEVLVEEADSVEEGQVLAKLDTSEWEDNLEILEDKLTAAERKLTPAERQVIAKELALIQAQINLQTAEYNLSEIADVKKIDDAIEEEELRLKFAKVMLIEAVKSENTLLNPNYWRNAMAFAQTRIAELERDRKGLLAGSSVKVTTDVAIEVATKKLQVEQAQRQLEDAQIAVEDAHIAVEDAWKEVKDAQEALDEALEDSPEVIAPFDGFIINVNVEGGDEVNKGHVAVTLADPTKFEADVLVNEMDIFQVKLGGGASVQVDAMSTLVLPAKVTHIAPTATIQSGVVNYTVKVELESLEAIQQERQEVRQKAMQDIAPGELPPRLQQAIEEGRITQEQAEEMVKQRQQGQGGPPGGQQGLTPTVIPEDFQLREGLTVTVSILVDERNDVLLVPNRAITTQGRQTYVQVLSPNGTIEERAITTGISNWQYTEVTEGLNEGEKVVVPQGTTTTPATQQRPPMMIPGMGRPPR